MNSKKKKTPPQKKTPQKQQQINKTGETEIRNYYNNQDLFLLGVLL